MKRLPILALALVALVTFVIAPVAQASAPVSSKRWPSMKYFGYITSGGNTAAYQWEGQHYDVGAAGETNSMVVHKQTNPGLQQYAYDVLQYQCPQNMDSINGLYDYVESRGARPEDMFIHYSEDSVLQMQSENGGFAAERFIRAWQYTGGRYLHKGDWNSADVGTFSFGATAGEMLYLGQHERFDEINFKMAGNASGSWGGVWEYWNGSGWSTLSVSDGTNMLHTSGRVSFNPPSSWRRGSVNNFKLYWVRLRVTNTSGAPTLGGPLSIRCANYITLVDSANKYYRIPGWDEAADANKDGYLNSSEWPNHASNKNARFKYWSRTVGRQFVDPLSWRINLGSQLTRDAFSAYLLKVVTTDHSGYRFDGIYFDEVSPGFNSALYGAMKNPISGGSMYEYPKPGGTSPGTADTAYNNDTAGALAAIKSALNAQGKKLGSFCADTGWTGSVTGNDYFMLETAWYSQNNYSRIYSLSDKYSTAKKIKDTRPYSVSLMMQYQNMLGNYIGNTAAVMDRSKVFGLATFYTLQDPNLDYFRSWNGVYYTSSNNNPQNHFVYAVAADIGTPTGRATTGFTALSDVPGGAFLFATGTDAGTGKTYQIVGREYTKGLVLSKPKPDYAADAAGSFGDNTATTHKLPVTSDNSSGQYYLVRPDGSVETTARTSITLRNCEGAILIKASGGSPNPPPGPAATVAITKTSNPADGSSAKAGALVTYTLTCKNTGATNATNVVASDTLASYLAYVPGSARLNGNAVSPDPISGNVVRVTVGNLAAGATATVTFQAAIK